MSNFVSPYKRIFKLSKALFGLVFIFFLNIEGFPQSQTFTIPGPGTFTVPHKVTSIDVRVWGAGGGGGFTNNNRGAGGGGGGAFILANGFPVTPGNNINITIGNGGIGQTSTNAAQAGGSSSFGTLNANGGSGASGQTSGAGGALSTGSYIYRSGGTSTNNDGTGNSPGRGGASAGNPTGNGTGSTDITGAVGVNGAGSGGNGGLGSGGNGENGTAPGGGGGGEGGDGIRGGNGGNGRIIISWTCPSPVMVSGSNDQTFCIGNTMSPVVFAVGGALNATVTGLPAGVNFSYNQGDVTISGTPTEVGAFIYTIRPQGSCEGNSIQGIIRVNPENTSGTITANTFCKNASLPANTFQPTNGATGIGSPSGLPAGIVVSFNNNQIEFTGAPTQTGVFNYSIPLTGGCGTVNATGTITVNEEVSVVNPNLTGQTSCPGTPFNPISVRDGFGLTYQWFSNTSASNSGGTAISGATLHTYTPSSVTVGTMYYYVEVSGACGSTVKSPASGAFIVQPGNSVTPASSSPTVCINSAIPSITHTTSLATGISNSGVSGANGLPSGVSATWSGNQISISGTPTAYGVFNYSIPLTGGCGTVAATGTITVNAAPEIITPNLPAQGACLNGTFSPLSVGLGTGLSYQWYSHTSASNTGGSIIPGAISNVFTPPANTVGQRHYYVQVTSACGTTVVSNASGLLEVYALPTPTFTTQPVSSICVDSNTVYSTESGKSNYQWGIPGVAGTDYTIVSGGTSIDNTITVRWLTPGNKSISINYTDTNGCTALNSTNSNSVTVQRNSFTTSTPAAPSVCVNTAMSPVTIGTTLATGIGTPNNLPSGVTATWASNTITLSGTPLDPGTYNYQIPLTGGCGTVSATGTLIVTPVYELTSISSVSPSFAGGSATVTIRGTSTNLPNGTYTITYSLGLANPGGPYTTTVNVVNGRGIFTTVPINNIDLTSLEILTIRRSTDSCTINLSENNVTFFGTCAAVFDANGEFFVPAGITEITIKVWGGGGGGGGRDSNNGAGGGGGGYSTINIPVTAGSVFNVVIGAGGAGQTSSGTPGQNGSPSYVTRNPNHADPSTSSIAYAYGGIGANGINAGIGGQGSTNNGQNGNLGTATDGGKGGDGGGSGGAGGLGGTGSGNNVGRPGTAPGGGGGGADGNTNGGNAGSGLVIISYSCPPIDPDGCFTVIDDGSRSGATIIEFTCDSDWIAPEGLIDFSVVTIGAGGGGGMGNAAGGGGAGGLNTGYVSTTAEFGFADGTTFNIKVGSGGVGASTINVTGQNGGFSSLTGTVEGNAVSIAAQGGGGGGSYGSTTVANGTSGASGGGGGFYRPDLYNGSGGGNIPGRGYSGSRGDHAFVPGQSGGAATGGGGGGSFEPGKMGNAAGVGQGKGGDGGNGLGYNLLGNIINYGGGGGGVGYDFNGQPLKAGLGGKAPNGTKMGGDGSPDGRGNDALGIGSGGGAGKTGAGNGGKGRVFIVYNNVRILPVEYIFIKADYLPQERLAEVTWATSKEWENSHFEVERSFQNINNWEKVGKVDGMGYSDEPVYYKFQDKNLPLTGGTVYYRLKQVDFSGNSQYSKVLSVKIPALQMTQGVWRAYPNPTDGDQLRVSLIDRSQYDEEKITFRIIHPMMYAVGMSVRNESEMNEFLSKAVRRIPRGVFVVEIQWGQKVEHIKVLRR